MVNSVWGMARSSAFVNERGFFTPVRLTVFSSLHTASKLKGSPFFSVTSGPQVVHDEHVVVISDGLVELDIGGGRLVLGHAVHKSAEEAAGVDPSLGSISLPSMFG